MINNFFLFADFSVSLAASACTFYGCEGRAKVDRAGYALIGAMTCLLAIFFLPRLLERQPYAQLAALVVTPLVCALVAKDIAEIVSEEEQAEAKRTFWRVFWLTAIWASIRFALPAYLSR